MERLPPAPNMDMKATKIVLSIFAKANAIIQFVRAKIKR